MEANASGRGTSVLSATKGPNAGPPSRPHRDLPSDDLAIASALQDLYNCAGLTEDLEEKMQLHTQALDLCPTGHPFRPGVLNNLACFFDDRYRRLGSVEDLENRIRTLTEALELCPLGHPVPSPPPMIQQFL